MKGTARTYHHLAEASGSVGTSLLSRRAWDALRTSGHRGFAIPDSRARWLSSFANRDDLQTRAKEVVALCHDLRLTHVFSVGVGGAALEYFIKAQDPGMCLTCTDFAPETVRRLAEVFVECDVVKQFDILSGTWKVTPDTLYLFHRVDTELSDEQWSEWFSHMAASGVEPVLVVASGFMTVGGRVRAAAAAVRHRLMGRSLTFCGYIRTVSRFAALWAPHYATQRRLSVGMLTGFLLTSNTPSHLSAMSATATEDVQGSAAVSR